MHDRDGDLERVLIPPVSLLSHYVIGIVFSLRDKIRWEKWVRILPFPQFARYRLRAVRLFKEIHLFVVILEDMARYIIKA